MLVSRRNPKKDRPFPLRGSLRSCANLPHGNNSKSWLRCAKQKPRRSPDEPSSHECYTCWNRVKRKESFHGIPTGLHATPWTEDTSFISSTRESSKASSSPRLHSRTTRRESSCSQSHLGRENISLTVSART